MLRETRLNGILEIIADRHYVQVDDLARLYNVSPMTIRRDLASLCDEGKIERCHGGARSKQVIVQETLYEQKASQHCEAKLKLATIAASLCNDDDVIYLDSGTTLCEVAAQLIEMHPRVTVVTNDLHIASMLVDAQVTVTIVGGLVSPITKSVLGHASESFLSQFRFSKAFLGTSSIDRNYDTFSPNYDKAFLKRLARDLSAENYLIADASKFYSTAMSYVSSLNQYTGVITDKVFSTEELEVIRAKGIKLIQ